jgi:sugar lactone lactonase YvrE
LIVDSKNNIYFTDQGQTSMMDQTGKVYRLSADGRLDCLIGNGISPNGLVLSVDEKTLYVAMTRSNQVWQLPLYSDGTTGKAQVFFQAFGPVGPDGLAMDQEGNLFICVPGLGRVFVVDRKGIPLKSIQGPHADTFITNCTFGGSDNKTLFLTDSLNGSILKLDWHCRGM